MTQRVSFRRSGSEGEGAHKTNSRMVQFDPFTLLRMLLERRRLIVLPTIAAFLISCAAVLLISNKFTSTASIMPSGSAGGDLADLKSLAGLGSSGSVQEASSELFPTILQSQAVTEVVMAGSYPTGRAGDHLSLADYFDQEDPDRLREALLDITSISTDKRTGVIRVGVETEWPVFSQAILEEYLRQLELYNRKERRSEARERAQYLTEQIARRQQELQAAEDSLAEYQLVNRNWVQSSDPIINRDIARLQRSVQTKTATYSYLVKELEVARLDVQKDTPITRILDGPSLPTQKSSPKRSIIVLLVTAVVGLVSVAIVLGSLLWQHLAQVENPESYQALVALVESDLPRLHRWTRFQRPSNTDATGSPRDGVSA